MNTRNDIEFYEKAADVSGHLYFARYDFSSSDDPPSFAHFHDSVEFILVREGNYLVHIGTQERLLSAGEIAFADSFVPHFYRAAGKAIVYAIVIDKNLFSGGALSSLVFSPFPAISAGNFAEIMRFFDTCSPNIFLNEQTKAGFSDLFAGLLYAFCPAQERKENKTARAFSEVLKYLNEHFCEEISLSALAARFSYAKNYFSALFNDFTGMSLREYVNRRRIAEVLRKKEKNPGISLFSLALDCGYVSEKTFYRALAKYGKKRQ